jgi:hypothetical protein
MPQLYCQGEHPQYPLNSRLGKGPELVWMLWKREKPLALVRNQTDIPQTSNV